jgi:CheY-like chemotaxis protein
VRQIQNSPDLVVVGQFDTIKEAVDAGLAERILADVVVVLQAFSDEYSAADAGHLIGRMLFGRVLCCYGPWCISEGRTHDIWPVVARVPVGSAWSVLEQEVSNIRAGVPALLPMAAAEEVFVHRAAVGSVRYPGSNDAILIVSDDRMLRETTAEMLRHAATQVFECGTSLNQLQRVFKKLIAANAAHSKVSVLLDIDGMESREGELLTMIRAQFSTSRLLRLSSFPQSIADNGTYDQIIDKLEVNTQLAPGRI